MLSDTSSMGVKHMDVRTRSALIITLLLCNSAWGAEFHDSLRAGVICSSEDNPVKLEILEPPAEDGFFQITGGLCKALAIEPDGNSTLFPVANCLLENEQQFSFFFGGWLDMLTAHFDEKDEGTDLICR
ncbi:MAG: hypothetical protein RIR26_521 [Pseudomonadota bacterium]|jgi:hypothetical protein